MLVIFIILSANNISWQRHYDIPSFITGWIPSCPEGNVTVVSDVNNSSLQLVEMCSSKEVWSPVCDNNWTLQDATVVCRELGQGKVLRCYILYVHLVFISYIQNTQDLRSSSHIH